MAFIRGQYWDWHYLTSLSAPWTVSCSAPSANCSNKTRRNSFKMKEGGFGLAIRKKFFTMSVVRDLEKLPKEVVKIPSMEDFKTRSLEDVPAHGRGSRTKGSLRSLPISYLTILWFYENHFRGLRPILAQAGSPSTTQYLPIQQSSTMWSVLEMWPVKTAGFRKKKCSARWRSFHCSALEHRHTNSWRNTPKRTATCSKAKACSGSLSLQICLQSNSNEELYPGK